MKSAAIRVGRNLAICVGALLAIVGLAVAWIAVRPLPVPMLIPPIAAALSDEDGGNQVSIDGAWLAWGGRYAGLEIRIDDVRVLGPEGDDLARFGSMRLELALDQLLAGRIAPRAVTFDAPAIHLTRNADGTLATGIGRGREGRSEASGLLPGLLRDLMSEESPDRTSSYLRTLAAQNASISLNDRVREMSWKAAPVDIEIEREDQGFGAQASLTLHATADPERLAGGESQVVIEASAQARQDGRDLTLDLTADLEDFDAAVLGSWWPRVAVPDAREWVITSIPAGTVDTAHLDLGLRFAEADPARMSLGALAARLEASALHIDYLAPLPPATDLRATLDFGVERFDFAIHSGVVEDIEIESGKVVITDLQEETSRIEIETRVKGPVSTVLELLDAEPLDLLADIPIEPDAVRGETEATLRFAFPLQNDLGLEDVEMKGTGKLHQIQVQGLPIEITEGELGFEFSETRMQLSGPVRLGGIPSQISWVEEFGRDTPTRSVVQAAMDAPKSNLRYESGKADATLSVHSDDLGTLLEALDGPDRIEGGTLQIDGRRTGPNAPLTGHFHMSDFVVLEAVWLVRLAQALSVQGFIDSLTGESFPIETFEGDFSLQNDELELRAVTFRGSYGIVSADGKLHRDPDEVHVRGTFVPLTTFNSWIQHVPVLSQIFTGSDEEGLFVADFVIDGPLQDPTVKVSRTSMAPGILRDLAETLTELDRDDEDEADAS